MLDIGDKSGQKNRECYAKPLGGCSGKLTREHFITEAILRRIGKSGQIELRGMPWQDQPNVYKKYSTKRINAKMLCERHHDALNKLKLDDAAIKLFDDLEAVYRSISEASPLRTIYHHDGQCIELWLLKALCGVFASGNAPRPVGHGDIPRQLVPLHVLRVLFGQEKFQRNCGLYLQNNGQKQINMQWGFKFTWYSIEIAVVETLVGCSVNLFGLELMLVIDELELKTNEKWSRDWLYRPKTFGIVKSKTNTHVEFVLKW